MRGDELNKMWVLVLAAASAVGVTGCSVFGSSSATTNPPSNNTVATVQQRVSDGNNNQVIYSELNTLHEDANNWVGWNHTPKWTTWDKGEQSTYLPAVEKLKQQVQANPQNATTTAVIHDLTNAEALLKIAKRVHQRQPLLYFHRIMSDLANYVYSTNKGDEYFGATHALKGVEAGTIDTYVANHS